MKRIFTSSKKICRIIFKSHIFGVGLTIVMFCVLRRVFQLFIRLQLSVVEDRTLGALLFTWASVIAIILTSYLLQVYNLVSFNTKPLVL